MLETGKIPPILSGAKRAVAKALYRPYIVFLLCLLFLSVNLIFDGALFRVFRMSRDLRIMRNRIQFMEARHESLKDKIQKADDPEAVERELRQKWDYAGPEDLIFIFPESI